MKLNIDNLGKVSVTVDKNPYDIRKDYDKLVIVKDVDGKVYLSRKPVPAQTPITDTDYWMHISSSDVLKSIEDYLGKANGIATLDSNAKLTESQLPSLKTINGFSIKGEGNINIDSMKYSVVTQLPTIGLSNTIYLVANSESTDTTNRYDEYIWADNRFEKLGSFSTKVDLSDIETELEKKANTYNIGWLLYPLINGEEIQSITEIEFTNLLNVVTQNNSYILATTNSEPNKTLASTEFKTYVDGSHKGINIIFRTDTKTYTLDISNNDFKPKLITTIVTEYVNISYITDAEETGTKITPEQVAELKKCAEDKSFVPYVYTTTIERNVYKNYVNSIYISTIDNAISYHIYVIIDNYEYMIFKDGTVQGKDHSPIRYNAGWLIEAVVDIDEIEPISKEEFDELDKVIRSLLSNSKGEIIAITSNNNFLSTISYNLFIDNYSNETEDIYISFEDTHNIYDFDISSNDYIPRVNIIKKAEQYDASYLFDKGNPFTSITSQQFAELYHAVVNRYNVVTSNSYKRNNLICIYSSHGTTAGTVKTIHLCFEDGYNQYDLDIDSQNRKPTVVITKKVNEYNATYLLSYEGDYGTLTDTQAAELEAAIKDEHCKIYFYETQQIDTKTITIKTYIQSSLISGNDGILYYIANIGDTIINEYISILFNEKIYLRYTNYSNAIYDIDYLFDTSHTITDKECTFLSTAIRKGAILKAPNNNFTTVSAYEDRRDNNVFYYISDKDRCITVDENNKTVTIDSATFEHNVTYLYTAVKNSATNPTLTQEQFNDITTRYSTFFYIKKDEINDYFATTVERNRTISNDVAYMILTFPNFDNGKTVKFKLYRDRHIETESIDPITPASTTNLGGIKLAESLSAPNQYPVKLTSNNEAYVEVQAGDTIEKFKIPYLLSYIEDQEVPTVTEFNDILAAIESGKQLYYEQTTNNNKIYNIKVIHSGTYVNTIDGKTVFTVHLEIPYGNEIKILILKCDGTTVTAKVQYPILNANSNNDGLLKSDDYVKLSKIPIVNISIDNNSGADEAYTIAQEEYNKLKNNGLILLNIFDNNIITDSKLCQCGCKYNTNTITYYILQWIYSENTFGQLRIYPDLSIQFKEIPFQSPDIATTTSFGVIKVGSGLSIDSSGVLTANAQTYDKATTTSDGLMSKEDKDTIDNILVVKLTTSTSGQPIITQEEFTKLTSRTNLPSSIALVKLCDSTGVITDKFIGQTATITDNSKKIVIVQCLTDYNTFTQFRISEDLTVVVKEIKFDNAVASNIMTNDAYQALDTKDNNTVYFIR